MANKTQKKIEIKKLETKKVKIDSIKKTINNVEYNINYIEIVYIGISDEASRIGIVTGKVYDFYKDRYKMPIPTLICEQDVNSLLLETGKGCISCRHGQDPTPLFMTKAEWDLDIAKAKVQNSK